MAVSAEVMAVLRRKCGYFEPEPGMDARVEDAVVAASPRVASLLGFPADHEFSEADGPAWGLFVNGCFYEYSDAWDDFAANYASEILSTRMYLMGRDADA